MHQIVLDCEIYKDYFLLAFKDISTGKNKSYELYDGSDPFPVDEVMQIMEGCETISFNGLKFDLPLITLACKGWDANYGKGSNLRRYLFCGSRQLVFKDGFTIPAWVTKENANEFGTDNKGQWRLLTPEECELLQTVPVGYTSIAPKLWRYRMLGNGWTVDVIVSILKGLRRSLKSV